MLYQGKAYPGGKQFHSLLPVLGKNGFAIPMLCVLDEQGQLLDAIRPTSPLVSSATSRILWG